MSKFLNTDLDTTLGGLTPSDEKVSSQKAIKTYVDTGLSGKQETLVSGTNIKTINSTSLLGSGNISIDGLPSQSGNSGKILATDGSAASWVDYIQLSTFPTPNASNEGRIVQYVGNSNINYTNGYFYRSTSSIQSARVTFAPNNRNIYMSYDYFATFIANHISESHAQDGPVVSGEMKFLGGDSNDPLWKFTGKNEYGSSIVTYTALQSAFANEHFLFRDTSGLSTGDTISFTVTEAVTVYAWARIDVQPTNGGSSLPSQAGNSGKFLTTDGTDPSWADIPTEIPTQTGNSGKFLTTDGTAVSWATVDALPSQSGQSGKFLTTNGTTPSWSTIAQSLSDLTDTVISSATTGQVLTYDGTAGKWKNETSYAMVITDYTA